MGDSGTGLLNVSVWGQTEVRPSRENGNPVSNQSPPIRHSHENGNPVSNQSPQATPYKVSRWDNVSHWIPVFTGMTEEGRGMTEEGHGDRIYSVPFRTTASEPAGDVQEQAVVGRLRAGVPAAPGAAHTASRRSSPDRQDRRRPQTGTPGGCRGNPRRPSASRRRT